MEGKGSWKVHSAPRVHGFSLAKSIRKEEESFFLLLGNTILLGPEVSPTFGFSTLFNCDFLFFKSIF